MPQIKVIDLSHHNTIPESLEFAFDAGVRGVIHKCTEGTSYVDKDADARFYLANQSRMLWGLYHFLRPGDMQKQAEFFWKTAQPYCDKNTLLAADHEDAGVSIGDLIEWLEIVEGLSGRSPVIYSGHVLKDQLKGKANEDLLRFRLWMAQYGSTPTLPPGFTDYYLWQYSDGDMGPSPHNVPGVNDPCDCNDYQGSDAELRATWSGAVKTIKPKPEIEIIVIVKMADEVIVKRF